MDRQRLVKLSKRMSKVLRHDPGRAGLRLDEAGWVAVEVFLAAMGMSRAELDAVVAGNDKQRFAVERGIDGVERIRANQGHSLLVDLQLPAAIPPGRLFHGTSTDSLDSIMASGLNRGRRHHVHLSPDVATAHRVGARRSGAVVILAVDAGAMADDGHVFYRSTNGVWLTAHVPSMYVEVWQK